MDVAYASKGITVVPDFLANAGGIIIVKEGMKDASYMDSDVMDKLKQIKFTTEEVLWRARDEKNWLLSSSTMKLTQSLHTILARR